MAIKRLVFLILGLLCLTLGTIGVFLPILPTVPFYLATVFCFSQSSQKLHDWFIGTELYKKHLKSFVEKKGMLMKTKVSIITTEILLTINKTIRFKFFSDILRPNIFVRSFR